MCVRVLCESFSFHGPNTESWRCTVNVGTVLQLFVFLYLDYSESEGEHIQYSLCPSSHE